MCDTAPLQLIRTDEFDIAHSDDLRKRKKKDLNERAVTRRSYLEKFMKQKIQTTGICRT